MNITKVLTSNCNKRPEGISVDRITIHCVVGEHPAKTVAGWFQKPSRQASATYIIGKNGEIVQNVELDYRPWTSGSRANDNRAITIECSSGAKDPYAFSDTVYQSLKELVIWYMKEHGKDTLVSIQDKGTALAYAPKSNEMLLTFHRWFQRVACPGEWFFNKAPEFAKEVNEALKGSEPKVKWYRVQSGAFKKKENADAMLERLKKEGIDSFIVCEYE